MRSRLGVVLLFVSMLLGSAMLLACGGGGASASAWTGARQMVLVIADDWDSDHAVLRAYTREGDTWRLDQAAADVMIGRKGSAWGLGLHPVSSDGPVKAEGDGRSPAGIFRIGSAFGYAETSATAMPYLGLTASDYCVDVSDSPYYNQIVDTQRVGEAAVAGSTEPMRRDLHLNGDQAYRFGFVIEHNPDALKDKGSCIFAHVRKSPATPAPTAGCTAMTQSTMERLLAWLDPKKQPVFVLLPKDEYARLRHSWSLPSSL